MTRRPNVVLIHADQQRYDSLGCCGNPCARTPNLDRLAADGTVFTRHVTSNPICMPSRASLFTGLYPCGHNVWCNGVALNRADYLPHNAGPATHGVVVEEPPTIGDVFSAAGYRTAGFGKFHLTPFLAPRQWGFPEEQAAQAEGVWREWRGPYYGYEHVELLIGHGEIPEGVYADWLAREHPDLVREVRQARRRPEELLVPGLGDLYASAIPAELHPSAWLGRRAADAIRQAAADDVPLCLFVGFPDPHHSFTPSFDVVREFEDADVLPPCDPRGESFEHPFLRADMGPGDSRPAGWSEEHRRIVARYTYAMVHQIDRAVGTILDAIDAAGRREDTIVAFTADHGDYLCDHGLLRKSYHPSHNLLHVPLLLRAPGAGLPARADSAVSNTDVLPTLAALAGVECPAGLHGRDVREGLDDGDRRVYAQSFAPGRPGEDSVTVYDGRYRCTLYPRGEYAELFDHVEDPGECCNLAAYPAHAARIEDFRRDLEQRSLQWTRYLQARVSAW